MTQYVSVLMVEVMGVFDHFIGFFMVGWCQCLVELGYVLTVAVEVKVKVTLEQTMKAQRGSRRIALLFL